MIALLTALTLTAAPLEAPASFEPTLFDTHEVVAGSGGDANVGGKLAFLTLGTLGTGGSLLAMMPLVSAISSDFGAVALLLPMLASVAIHVGLGSLLGVDVSWASAGVGALFGAATAVGFGFLLISTVGQGDLGDVILFVLGMIAGYAVGTPVFTLLDPFGLARFGGTGGDVAPATERAVAIDARPLDLRAPEAVGTGIGLWAGRW